MTEKKYKYKIGWDNTNFSLVFYAGECFNSSVDLDFMELSQHFWIDDSEYNRLTEMFQLEDCEEKLISKEENISIRVTFMEAGVKFENYLSFVCPLLSGEDDSVVSIPIIQVLEECK